MAVWQHQGEVMVVAAVAEGIAVGRAAASGAEHPERRNHHAA